MYSVFDRLLGRGESKLKSELEIAVQTEDHLRAEITRLKNENETLVGENHDLKAEIETLQMENSMSDARLRVVGYDDTFVTRPLLHKEQNCCCVM